ncbi:hypothetical protein RclHR1_02540019 [Rhizophagus clarus]|uniref:F-box domain-containing protein n=1 Tax=Rhizophagus clarus TaxID=94130 RepID=A0A2Z6R0L4_9GLOM|nr:hypothetical protein RclHR1_02540019 [Rhizophagus clarus]GES82030.1 hypothetical protein GLOIN_2v1762775 [Rhizophagus clarus]
MSTAFFFPPEILQNIFQILIDYANKTFDIRARKFSSLQKCLLVDRYWFANAVIFLWKNPIRPNLKRNYTTSKLLISTYISCLSESSKILLYENNIINLNQRISTPFCYYNNLLRDLDFTELFFKVSYFLLNPEDENLDILTLEKSDPIGIIKCYDNDLIDQKRILLFGELVKLFTSQPSSRLIYNLKMVNWIKNKIRRYPHLQFLSNFISPTSSSLNLSYLECQTCIPSQIFDELSKVISTIDEIYVKCDSYFGGDNEGLFNFLCGLKKIHLLKIEFDHFKFKNFNNIIKFTSFITDNYELKIPSDEPIPLDLSLNFNKIIGFEITDSGIDSINIVRSWSNLQFLPFLTTLKIFTGTLIKLDLELYSDIIKKTNGNLLKLGISLDDGLFFHNIHLFNTISTYCPKLKDFDLKIKGRLLYYIPLILQNCKDLEKINLEIMDDKNITLLMYKIGKELPKNLKSFYIYQEVVKWDVKFFHIFLKYCKLNSLFNLKFKFKYSYPIDNMKEYSRIIKKYIKKGTLSRWSRIKEMNFDNNNASNLLIFV